MKEYVKAVRHDTLRAIDNAERLVHSLGDEDAAGTNKLRKATERFARHLKDRKVSTGPRFAYFRDWVDYTGIATPAYGTARTYPVGRTQPSTPAARAARITASASTSPSTAARTARLRAPGIDRAYPAAGGTPRRPLVSAG